MRQATYARLLTALRRPWAFSRLVDALPPSRTKWRLQCWGLLHGHYHMHVMPPGPRRDRPGRHNVPPHTSPPHDRAGRHDAPPHDGPPPTPGPCAPAPPLPPRADPGA